MKTRSGRGSVLRIKPGQPVGTPEISEAADPADDASKLIRTVPRRDKRADPAGAQAGDPMVVRILREVVGPGDLGDELVDQEVGKPRRQRVVLEDELVSILSRIGERGHDPWIDEHR